MRRPMGVKNLAGMLSVALFAFQVAPAADAGTYRVLYDFNGSYGVGGPDGGPPLAAPVLAPNGDVYGPAGGGMGSEQCDGPAAWSLKLERRADGTWRESVALNLSTYFDLAAPNSPLAFDARGNLYGSLQGGIAETGSFK